MLELLSCPVYLKRRKPVSSSFLIIKTQKAIIVAVFCEPGSYPVFISRTIVALAALLTQMANSETSKVKVLTSGGGGML